MPGSSFYSRPELGRDLIRFTFCKTDDVLEEANQRLSPEAVAALMVGKRKGGGDGLTEHVV